MFDDFDHVDVRQIGRLTEFCQVQLNDQGVAHDGLLRLWDQKFSLGLNAAFFASSCHNALTSSSDVFGMTALSCTNR